MTDLFIDVKLFLSIGQDITENHEIEKSQNSVRRLFCGNLYFESRPDT